MWVAAASGHWAAQGSIATDLVGGVLDHSPSGYAAIGI